MFDEDIKQLKEFDEHRLISVLDDPKSGLQGFVTIHRGGSYAPAFGATRVWEYPSKVEALKDALKLSKMMSYKSALAGLPYGGGKAVLMASSQSLEKRERMLRSYADHVKNLEGKFITGTDMGLYQSDLSFMSEACPYFVGLNVDPTVFTGQGLFGALEVCLKKIFGTANVAGKSFAIVGAGKIGRELLRRIYNAEGHSEAKIYISDIDSEKALRVKKLFPQVELVSPNNVHTLAVDVYSPCGASNALTVRNIHELRCQMIVGGANNQLESQEVGEHLHRMGILYAPDYVVNAGGLMSVTSEFENPKNPEETIQERLTQISETLSCILNESSRLNRATNIIADEMAETILKTYV